MTVKAQTKPKTTPKKKAVNKGGRPSERTKAVVAKLEAAFQNGMNITQACRYAKIDRVTYYRWLDADEEFSNKMDEAQEFLIVKAKQVLAELIQAGDDKTAKYWLDRKAKDEFASRTELTGAEGSELFEKEATKLAELIALAKAHDVKPEPTSDEPDGSDAEGESSQSQKTDS